MEKAWHSPAPRPRARHGTCLNTAPGTPDIKPVLLFVEGLELVHLEHFRGACRTPCARGGAPAHLGRGTACPPAGSPACVGSYSAAQRAWQSPWGPADSSGVAGTVRWCQV